MKSNADKVFDFQKENNIWLISIALNDEGEQPENPHNGYCEATEEYCLVWDCVAVIKGDDGEPLDELAEYTVSHESLCLLLYGID